MNPAHMLKQRIFMKSFCFRPLTEVMTGKSNAPPGGPHFGSNSPLHGAQRESNARGLPGGMGGFVIDWHIIASVKFHFHSTVSAFIYQTSLCYNSRHQVGSFKRRRSQNSNRVISHCISLHRVCADYEKSAGRKGKIMQQACRHGKSHQSKETNKNFIQRYRKIA